MLCRSCGHGACQKARPGPHKVQRTRGKVFGGGGAGRGVRCAPLPMLLPVLQIGRGGGRGGSGGDVCWVALGGAGSGGCGCCMVGAGCEGVRGRAWALGLTASSTVPGAPPTHPQFPAPHRPIHMRRVTCRSELLHVLLKMSTLTCADCHYYAVQCVPFYVFRYVELHYCYPPLPLPPPRLSRTSRPRRACGTRCCVMMGWQRAHGARPAFRSCCLSGPGTGSGGARSLAASTAFSGAWRPTAGAVTSTSCWPSFFYPLFFARFRERRATTLDCGVHHAARRAVLIGACSALLCPFWGPLQAIAGAPQLG